MKVTIRRATTQDASAIARVHVDSWRTTYRNLLPGSILDHLKYEEREAFWSGVLSGRASNDFAYVAERENRLIGFASGGPERSGNVDFTGELYAIYVLADCQKLGAGRQLFGSIVEQILKADYIGMLLWVLDRNPACGFYEAMGGRVIDRKNEQFGESTLVELAYGWTREDLLCTAK